MRMDRALDGCAVQVGRSGCKPRRRPDHFWHDPEVFGVAAAISRSGLPRGTETWKTMRTDYKDIRDRIAEFPKWFDECGTPRYCDFHPRELANIYANEAALMLVTCAACGQGYQVATSNLTMLPWGQAKNPEPASSQPELTPLAQAIRDRTIQYGDPPNACPETCGGMGASMLSESQRILQYWQRTSPIGGWRRDPNFEVDVQTDWTK
jgi:hypothetical protein